MAAADELSIRERFQKAILMSNPSKNNAKLAAKRHTKVRELLSKEPWVESSFLTGSYARSTATRPINDVDFILVVHSRKLPVAADPRECVRQFLSQHKQRIGFNRIRDQDHSVGLHWDRGPCIDVVLGRKNDGGYQIPKKDSGWIATYPQQAKDTATRANEECKRNLIPLVKLLKRWNAEAAPKKRRAKDGEMKKPLKSYHLEVMCYDVNRDEFNGQPHQLARLVVLLQHLATKVTDQYLSAPGPGVTPFHTYFESGDHPWTVKEVKKILEQGLSCCSSAVKLETSSPERAHQELCAFFHDIY